VATFLAQGFFNRLIGSSNGAPRARAVMNYCEPRNVNGGGELGGFGNGFGNGLTASGTWRITADVRLWVLTQIGTHVKKKETSRAVPAGGATTRSARPVKSTLYCRPKAAGGAVLRESAACRLGPLNSFATSIPLPPRLFSSSLRSLVSGARSYGRPACAGNQIPQNRGVDHEWVREQTFALPEGA
jgi:hypothetical protein